MLPILLVALGISAASAAGVVRYILYGQESEGSTSLGNALPKDPEYARAVRALLDDVEVNLRRLHRAQPGPQRSVRVRQLHESLSGQHFLSSSPVLKEVEWAVRARTAPLLEEDRRVAAEMREAERKERLVAALLEGERRLARAGGLD